MVTTNPYKRTSDFIASEQGREFMIKNDSMMEKFVKHCSSKLLLSYYKSLQTNFRLHCFRTREIIHEKEW